MADIIQIGDPRVDLELQRYFDELDALARAALEKEMPESEFRQDAERAALAAMFLFFPLGGGDVSLPGASNELARRRTVVRSSVVKLASDIYSGKYSRVEAEGAVQQTVEEGREKLRNRLTLWANDAGGDYTRGQVYAPPRLNGETGRVEEPRYTWRLGATEQHCSDCLFFNGQTLTASEWRQLPAPQSPDLECGGWLCDCSLVPTTEPSVGIENLGLLV